MLIIQGLASQGCAILIGSFLTLVVLAYFFTIVSRILLFWIALALASPFGATFSDLLTKTREKGGLNFGTFGSSLVLCMFFAMLVAVAIWKYNQTKK